MAASVTLELCQPSDLSGERLWESSDPWCIYSRCHIFDLLVCWQTICVLWQYSFPERPQWRWRWCWAVRRIMGNDMRRRNFWARAALERWFSENIKQKAESLICSHTNHQGVSSQVPKEREIICSKAVGHNKEEAERQRFGRDQPYQRPRQPLHHKVFHFSDLGFLLNLQSCQIHRGFWDGQGHCASDGASPGRGTLWEVCWWGGHSHRGQYHCHRRSNKWKKKLILSSELIWMFFFSPSFSNILLPGGLLPFCQTGLKSPVIWIILFTVLVSLVSVSFHSSVFHFWYFSHSSKGQQRFGISSQQVHRPSWSKGNETRPSKLCETQI